MSGLSSPLGSMAIISQMLVVSIGMTVHLLSIFQTAPMFFDVELKDEDTGGSCRLIWHQNA